MSRKSQPNEYMTLPLPGEENWGNTINAALDKIDDELGKRALDADLTAHEGANAAHRAATIDCEMADTILHGGTPYLGKVEEMLRAIYGYTVGMTPHGVSLLTLYNHIHGSWSHEAVKIKTDDEISLQEVLNNINGKLDPLMVEPEPVTNIKTSQPADTYSVKMSWDPDFIGVSFVDVFILFDDSEDTQIDNTNYGDCLHVVCSGNHLDYRLTEQPTGASYLHVNCRRRNLIGSSSLEANSTSHLAITPPPSLLNDSTLNYLADILITKIKDSTGNRCTRG